MLKGTKEQTVVNQRLSKIPRFHGLKTFENGLPTHTITAAEYRQLMLLMPFVIEGLGCSSLSKLYFEFAKMFLMSWRNCFSESDLNKLQV